MRLWPNMKKILALALAVGVSGCATAHNGYYNGHWNPHYSRNHTHVSDKTVAALVGAIAVGALIESSARQREHERELLRQKPNVVQIGGVWYREEYKAYSPCPTERKRTCVVLTRTPI